MEVDGLRVPQWLRWALVVAVAGLLLVGSLAPVSGLLPVELPFLGDGSGEGEGGGVSLFALAHLLGYAILAGTLAFALADASHRWVLSRPRWQVFAVVLGVTVAYGAFIELLQGLVPYRFFSYGDIALNALGAAIGIVCWRILARVSTAGRTS